MGFSMSVLDRSKSQLVCKTREKEKSVERSYLVLMRVSSWGKKTGFIGEMQCQRKDFNVS